MNQKKTKNIKIKLNIFIFPKFYFLLLLKKKPQRGTVSFFNHSYAILSPCS